MWSACVACVSRTARFRRVRRHMRVRRARPGALLGMSRLVRRLRVIFVALSDSRQKRRRRMRRRARRLVCACVGAGSACSSVCRILSGACVWCARVACVSRTARDSVVCVVTCGFVAPCSTRSPAYLRRPARGLQVACVWPASWFTISAVCNSVVCDEATCDDAHGALCA